MDANPDSLDLDKTVELIRLFIAEGVKVVYVSTDQAGKGQEIIDELKKEEHGANVQPELGHLNHFHVLFAMEAPMDKTLENVTQNPPGPVQAGSGVVAFSFQIKDTRGIPMPEHTLVYVREENGENAPADGDLVQLDGAYKVYPARADADGVVTMNVNPINAGTAAIGVYRPNEFRDGTGTRFGALDNEVFAEERIGTLTLTIEPPPGP